MKQLKAISPCYIGGDENRPALTVGKFYEVVSEDYDFVMVVDDEGDPHSFSKDTLSEFFEIPDLTSSENCQSIPEMKLTHDEFVEAITHFIAVTDFEAIHRAFGLEQRVAINDMIDCVSEACKTGRSVNGVFQCEIEDKNVTIRSILTSNTAYLKLPF